jgi:hypothetical protein
VQLHLGEEYRVFEGITRRGGNPYIMNSVKNIYLKLIGLYEENKIKAWLNTIFPVGFILRLPAKIVKFLINSIFDIQISDQNIIWKIISFPINLITYVLSLFQFLDRIGYSSKLDSFIKFAKEFFKGIFSF